MSDSEQRFNVTIEPQPEADPQSQDEPETKAWGPRWVWTVERETRLIEIIHAERVWEVPYGRVTQLWDSIPNRLVSSLTPKPSITPSQRTCKMKYESLCRLAQKENEVTAVESRSGTNSEVQTPYHAMLMDCITLTQQHEDAE